MTLIRWLNNISLQTARGWKRLLHAVSVASLPQAACGEPWMKHSLQQPSSDPRRTCADYSCAVRATACTDASVTPRAAASCPSKAAACTRSSSRSSGHMLMHATKALALLTKL